jgi:hypothetical protein
VRVPRACTPSPGTCSSSGISSRRTIALHDARDYLLLLLLREQRRHQKYLHPALVVGVGA